MDVHIYLHVVQHVKPEWFYQKIVHDVILCGLLGSKYQLTNQPRGLFKQGSRSVKLHSERKWSPSMNDTGKESVIFSVQIIENVIHYIINTVLCQLKRGIVSCLQMTGITIIHCFCLNGSAVSSHHLCIPCSGRCWHWDVWSGHWHRCGKYMSCGWAIVRVFRLLAFQGFPLVSSFSPWSNWLTGVFQPVL